VSQILGVPTMLDMMRSELSRQTSVARQCVDVMNRESLKDRSLFPAGPMEPTGKNSGKAGAMERSVCGVCLHNHLTAVMNTPDLHNTAFINE
jgi:hypothetical protein